MNDNEEIYADGAAEVKGDAPSDPGKPSLQPLPPAKAAKPVWSQKATPAVTQHAVGVLNNNNHSEESKFPTKPPVTKPITAMKPTIQVKPPHFANGSAVNATNSTENETSVVGVKARLAMLQTTANSALPSKKPALGVKVSLLPSVQPPVQPTVHTAGKVAQSTPTNEIDKKDLTQELTTKIKPLLPLKPLPTTSVSCCSPTETGESAAPQSTGATPVISLMDIVGRKHSLKKTGFDKSGTTGNRQLLAEEPPKQDPVAVLGVDGKLYVKVAFNNKSLTQPDKPPSLEAVTLPMVHNSMGISVECRETSGRTNITSQTESYIKSMTEEEEHEGETKETMNEELYGDGEADITPSLPTRPPPSIKVVLEGKPARPPPDVEDTYDDGEAMKEKVVDEEVYESFDEDDSPKRPQPNSPVQRSPSNSNVIRSPDLPRDVQKQEETKRKNDLQKEKKRLEKEAKDKEKARLKEAQEQENIIRKYKISVDDLNTSNYVKVIKGCKGGKEMLAVTDNECIFLVRKTGCPKGKWLARNKNSQVGLVDISNVVDPNVTDSHADDTYDDGQLDGDEEVYQTVD